MMNTLRKTVSLRRKPTEKQRDTAVVIPGNGNGYGASSPTDENNPSSPLSPSNPPTSYGQYPSQSQSQLPRQSSDSYGYSPSRPSQSDSYGYIYTNTPAPTQSRPSQSQPSHLRSSPSQGSPTNVVRSFFQVGGGDSRKEKEREKEKEQSKDSSLFGKLVEAPEVTYSATLWKLGDMLLLPVHCLPPFDVCVRLLNGALDALQHGGANGRGMDDRKMLLESIIVFLSRLPRNSQLTSFLNDRLITLLWNDLTHPPNSFLALPVPHDVIVQVQSPISNTQGTGTGMGTGDIQHNGHTDRIEKPSAGGERSIVVCPHPLPGGTDSHTSSSSLCPFASSSISATRYPYHTPSGTHNAPFNPLLGSARTPYARTVQSTSSLNPSTLPDPGMVFDVLMARPHPKSGEMEGKDWHHPGGLSSLFFAFANLVIHSLFQTSVGAVRESPTSPEFSDPNADSNSGAGGEGEMEGEEGDYINLTSSYLDLSPLYGTDAEQLKSVRRFDGTGRLWEDVWADERIGYMPPSSVAMVIIFCRNHNYVATMLLSINECGWYKDPDTFGSNGNDEMKKRKQDEHIFERARLINCHHFMGVIVSDYIGAILGLTREGNDFTLKPLGEMTEGAGLKPGGAKTPRGVGNAVSVEFNLLYRWHATLSPSEVAHTEMLFAHVFKEDSTPGKETRSNSSSSKPKDTSTLTPTEFATRIAQVKARDKSKNPQDRMLPLPPNSPLLANGGGQRTRNGGFEHGTIAAILKNATLEHAHMFGARCIPRVMRVVEMMGIEQARRWGSGSLNDLRRVLGLKEFETFKEWNCNDQIAKAAEALYGHIDRLELYPGLMAEESKPPIPGAGLCPGYTISRAILSDAVALVRGDRMLSIERTPTMMTCWGYKDTEPEEGRSTLAKILYRTVPGAYEYDSVMAHFPFMVPESLKAESLRCKPEMVGKYDWTTEDPLPIPALPGSSLAPAPAPPVPPIAVANGLRFKLPGHRKAPPSSNGNGNGYGYAAADVPPPVPPKVIDVEGGIGKIRKKPTHVRNLDLSKGHSMLDVFAHAQASMDAMLLLIRAALVTTMSGSKVTIGLPTILNPDPDLREAGAKLMREAIIPPPIADATKQEFRRYVYNNLTDWIAKEAVTFSIINPKSGQITDVKKVDLAKAIGPTAVHFVADETIKCFRGYKIEDFRNVFDHVFCAPYTTDQNGAWHLKQKAISVGIAMARDIKWEMKQFTSAITSMFRQSDSFLGRLCPKGSKKNDDQTAAEIFAFVISLVTLWDLAANMVINFYLDDARSEERKAIYDLCKGRDRDWDDTDHILEGYVREALRIDPPVPIVMRTVAEGGKDAKIPGRADENLAVGDMIAVQPPPLKDDEKDTVNPRRSDFFHKAAQYGLGDHAILVAPVILETLPQVLRVVFTLPGLKPMTKGGVNRFMCPLDPLSDDPRAEWRYQGSDGSVSRWPQTFLVQYTTSSKETGGFQRKS